MADFKSSSDVPSHESVEGALRNAVETAFRNGKSGSLTMRTVRRTAEDALDLGEDFLKHSTKWRDLSKSIITDEVSKQEDHEHESGREQEQVEDAEGSGSESKSADHQSGEPALSVAGIKRKAPEDAVANQRKTKTSLHRSGAGNVEAQVDSANMDDEFSDVVDEKPRKKRKSKQDRVEPSRSSKGKSRTKPSANKSVDPEEAEMKKLQGQLLKCGVRRVWGKVLASYDTPREKIGCLRQMLKDAGMGGRFSEEKAAKIKEQRELEEDLQTVVERNKTWGREDEGSEESADTKTRGRRLASGLNEIAMFDDEESD